MVDMPEIPDEDHDFTPDLARKIIGLYQTRIRALEAGLTKAKAALHIATNDKLSLLEQLDTERQGRMAQIDYSCDLQRIIEDLCRGGPVREPKTSARRHYDMATAFLSALEATPPAPVVTFPGCVVSLNGTKISMAFETDEDAQTVFRLIEHIIDSTASEAK